MVEVFECCDGLHIYWLFIGRTCDLDKLGVLGGISEHEITTTPVEKVFVLLCYEVMST